MSQYEELERIAKAAEKLAPKPDPAWVKSPFKWILALPSRSKGSFGERLVQEIFRVNGFDVKRPASGSDHDRVINGHRIEIKMSTLWTKNGHYKFQQIRNQHYDFLLFLGLSPNSAHCWLVPKEEVYDGREGVSHQHAGKAGSDTLWLTFPATKPPTWLKGFGGTIDQAQKLMKAAKRGSHPGRELLAKDKLV